MEPPAWWCGDVAAGGGGFGEWDPLLASLVKNVEWEADCGGNCKASPEREALASAVCGAGASPTPARRKRRRARAVKNREEMECQRMTHIAVERNRRRQMNEYLAVLRSLMPPSNAHRGDQASIVGGAINYVKDLEQHLQSLEAHKSKKEQHGGGGESPFAGFFTSPQYSTSHGSSGDDSAGKSKTEPSTAAADIEASMAEGHTNLKVQAARRPRQLLKLVAGLQQLGLTTLHLNVTTAGDMAMYTISLKVEEECKLGSVEQIAAQVHEILGRMQEDPARSS